MITLEQYCKIRNGCNSFITKQEYKCFGIDEIERTSQFLRSNKNTPLDPSKVIDLLSLMRDKGIDENKIKKVTDLLIENKQSSTDNHEVYYSVILISDEGELYYPRMVEFNDGWSNYHIEQFGDNMNFPDKNCLKFSPKMIRIYLTNYIPSVTEPEINIVKKELIKVKRHKINKKCEIIRLTDSEKLDILSQLKIQIN